MSQRGAWPGGRVLGVDIGKRRVGLAVSDSDGRVALPYDVLDRRFPGTGESPGRSSISLATLLLPALSETDACRIVVGVPLSLDGTMGPSAKDALEDIAVLRSELGIPVETVDERLTTVVSCRHRVRAGVSEQRGRDRVDAHAAAELLQTWLDREARSGNPQPGNR